MVRSDSGVRVEVADRGVAGQFVEAQVRRPRQAGGGEHACRDEVVERHAARAFGDEREHHVAAVAVREPLARRELLREAVQRPHERLGLGELVHRHGQDVVVDLPLALLVEVVADPRRVAEQLLDRHRVVDQRQVVVQDAAHGRVEPERAVVHE